MKTVQNGEGQRGHAPVPFARFFQWLFCWRVKYHRTAEGRFVLYSVGWNEKDDGGVPGKTGLEGDWVWP